MCYTYDEQSRVVKRPVISLSGTTETEEAGDWIAETANDAWNATTGFFEDVGGFFCALFA